MTLAACGSKQEPVKAKTETAPAVAPTPRLSGQWRVTALGGKPVDAEQPPIFLSVNNDKIFANSQCVWWLWAYQINGNRFTAKSAPRLIKSENGEMTTPAMCARGLHLQEERFAKSVEAADKMISASPTTMILNGKGSAIRLERRPGIEGRWIVVAMNGRPVPPDHYPILVDISDREIAAQSQCVALFWTYSQKGAAIRTRPARLDQPICERGRSQTELLFEALVGKVAMWRTLTDNGLYFQTGDETITLQPQL